MSDVADEVFDFSLLMRLSRVGGPGDNGKGAEKVEEGVIIPDKGPFPLGNGGEHVVHHHFLGRAVHETEGTKKRTMQGFLSLGVGKLQVHEAAVGFHQGEAIQFSAGLAIGDSAEVTPVDLALPAGGRFEADEGALMARGSADHPEVVFDDGVPAGKALLCNALMDEGG